MTNEIKDTKLKKILRTIPITIFTVTQFVCLYLLYVLTAFTIHFSADYEENILFERIFITVIFLLVPISNIFILFWLKLQLKYKFLIQLGVLVLFAIVYLITINLV